MTGAQDMFNAMDRGDLRELRRLLAADPALASAKSDEGLSAMLYAIYRGRTEMVEAILQSHPDMDVFDAAAVGADGRLASLLEADPGLARGWSIDGFTPLHLAVFFGHVEAARLLLEAGADPIVVSRNRMAVMPLHSAVAGVVPDRRAEIAGVLLAHGADVNAPTHLGFTPLHEAAQNGDRATLEVLLAHGADPSIRQEQGKSAADLARQGGHQALVDLLGQPGGGG